MASLADALAYQAKRSQYMDDMTEQPSDLEKAVQDQFGMQPNMDRGALLPYKSKDKGWVAPEVAYQLAKLLASPSVAMHGGNISPQEAIESGNTLSGFMTPAGLLSKPSPATARMNVYHGTPHEFDKFDSSKIGTGEGAQAYGHGVYFAENPAVAKEYQKVSPSVNPPIRRAFKGQELAAGTWEYKAASLVDEMGLLKARKLVQNWISGAREGEDVAGYKKALDTLSVAESKKDFARMKNQGSFYHVDLPDEHIAKMLDWDKPLSEQPENVRKALESHPAIAAEIARRNEKRVLLNEQSPGRLAHPVIGKLAGKEAVANDLKGSELYQTLSNYFRDEDSAWSSLGITPNDAKNIHDAASRYAAKLGIPGIRYLDGDSRTGGAGTSNFVVFPGEEHNLKILKRE